MYRRAIQTAALMAVVLLATAGAQAANVTVVLTGDGGGGFNINPDPVFVNPGDTITWQPSASISTIAGCGAGNWTVEIDFVANAPWPAPDNSYMTTDVTPVTSAQVPNELGQFKYSITITPNGGGAPCLFVDPTVHVSTPTAIPTLGEWGAIGLVVLLVGSGALFIYRRRS